jgi:hypothetical protein
MTERMGRKVGTGSVMTDGMGVMGVGTRVGTEGMGVVRGGIDAGTEALSPSVCAYLCAFMYLLHLFAG